MNGRELVFAALTLLFAGVIAGARSEWTASGPPGGAGTIAVDPANFGTLYALGGGLFKSVDAGRTWRPLRLSIANPSSIAVAASESSVVYVGFLNGRILRSADGGGTWSRADAGIPRSTIYRSSEIDSIAVDPGDADVAYVGTPSFGIFKTVDGGESWTAVNSGLPDRTLVSAIGIDPTSPSTIYISANSGVLKSLDGGASWIVESGGNSGASAIVVVPDDPKVVYEAGPGNDIAKSQDGGASWRLISTGLPTDALISALVLDPTHPTTIFVSALEPSSRGSVFRSEDGGSSWAQVYSAPSSQGDSPLDLYVPNVTVAAAADGSAVYFGNSVAVFRSEDGGTTWTAGNSGLFDSRVLCLAFDSAGTLYAGTAGSSLFKKAAGREDWTALDLTGAGASTVRSLAVSPGNPAVIYAGVDNNALYESADGGRTWTSMLSLLQFHVSAIAIDPADPRIVYGFFSWAGARLYGPSYLARSDDGGKSWTGGIGNLYSASWLAIDPRTPSTLYAGSPGLFRSTDSGVHWIALPTVEGAVGEVSPVVFDPSHPSTLYAGLGRFNGPAAGVLKSEDGGAHWNLHRSGLPDDPISSLAIDPLHPNVLYAGTLDESVFVSHDNGDTWDPLDRGLANRTVLTIAIDPIGLRPVVGTAAGVSELSGPTVLPLAAPPVAPTAGRSRGKGTGD